MNMNVTARSIHTESIGFHIRGSIPEMIPHSCVTQNEGIVGCRYDTRLLLATMNALDMDEIL